MLVSSSLFWPISWTRSRSATNGGILHSLCVCVCACVCVCVEANNEVLVEGFTNLKGPLDKNLWDNQSRVFLSCTWPGDYLTQLWN